MLFLCDSYFAFYELLLYTGKKDYCLNYVNLSCIHIEYFMVIFMKNVLFTPLTKQQHDEKVNQLFSNIFSTCSALKICVPPNVLDIFAVYRSYMLSIDPSDNICTDMRLEHNLSYSGVFFTYVWNIHALLNDMNKHTLYTTELDTESVCSLITPNNLYQDRVNFYMNSPITTPIILAKIPFVTGNTILLDGSHRAQAAYNLGKKTITSYSFDVDYHTRFLTSYSKTMFSLMCGLHKIISDLVA